MEISLGNLTDESYESLTSEKKKMKHLTTLHYMVWYLSSEHTCAYLENNREYNRAFYPLSIQLLLRDHWQMKQFKLDKRLLAGYQVRHSIEFLPFAKPLKHGVNTTFHEVGHVWSSSQL